MNALRRASSSTGLLTCLCGIGLLACLCAAQEASRSVWDGVYTTEQSKRGEALYARECASCHGDLLTGGEQAPPLAGGEFLSNWNGLTLGDLFERIRKTMPMNKPGKLTREVNADILAFMLAVNKFPAGNTELSHTTESLNQIRLEATKSHEGEKK
jgi:cytochrome c